MRRACWLDGIEGTGKSGIDPKDDASEMAEEFVSGRDERKDDGESNSSIGSD
jgi:hypothetical protein